MMLGVHLTLQIMHTRCWLVPCGTSPCGSETRPKVEYILWMQAVTAGNCIHAFTTAEQVKPQTSGHPYTTTPSALCTQLAEGCCSVH
jgi:hypothetical protein